MGSLLVVVEASFGDVGYVGLPTACAEFGVEVAVACVPDAAVQAVVPCSDRVAHFRDLD